MRWRRRTKTIHVGRLDRQMAEADALLRVVQQGYRSPVVKSSERIFDLEGRPVWEVELAVGRRSKEIPR